MIDPRPILEALDQITAERHERLARWTLPLLAAGLTLLLVWCGCWLAQ